MRFINRFRIFILIFGLLASVHSSAQKQYSKGFNDSILIRAENSARKMIDSFLPCIEAWENEHIQRPYYAGDIRYPNQKIDSIKAIAVLKVEPVILGERVINERIFFDDSSETCAIAYPFLKAYVYTPGLACSGYPYAQELVNMVTAPPDILSGRIFLCYFLEREKHLRNNLLVIYPDGQLKFRADNQEFSILQDMLIYRYGSLTRYRELVAMLAEANLWRSYKDSMVAHFDIPGQYKSFIRSSWGLRAEIYPKDTLGNIIFFLESNRDKLKKYATGELTKLSLEIYRKFQTGDLPSGWNLGHTCRDSMISLMNRDLYAVLKPHLLHSQLSDLVERCKVHDILKDAVNDYIFNNIGELSGWRPTEGKVPLDLYINKVKEYISAIFSTPPNISQQGASKINRIQLKE